MFTGIGLLILLGWVTLAGQTAGETGIYALDGDDLELAWWQEEAENAPPPEPMIYPGSPDKPWLQHSPRQSRMVRMWKLTEYLELSEEQAEKFFPRARAHRDEMQKIGEQRRELHLKFVKEIEDGKASGRDTKKFADELHRLDLARLELRRKHIKDVEDVLTDIQLARYVTFDEHFMGQLRQRLDNRKTRHEMQRKTFKGRRDLPRAIPRLDWFNR